MRENRLSGSEGGGAANPALPTPIQGGLRAQMHFFSNLPVRRSTLHGCNQVCYFTCDASSTAHRRNRCGSE